MCRWSVRIHIFYAATAASSTIAADNLRALSARSCSDLTIQCPTYSHSTFCLKDLIHNFKAWLFFPRYWASPPCLQIPPKRQIRSSRWDGPLSPNYSSRAGWCRSGFTHYEAHYAFLWLLSESSYFFAQNETAGCCLTCTHVFKHRPLMLHTLGLRHQIYTYIAHTQSHVCQCFSRGFTVFVWYCITNSFGVKQSFLPIFP